MKRAESKELVTQGVALQKSGHHQKAATLYKRVLETDPGNVDATHLLGLTFYQNKDFQTAKDLIGRALQAAPNEPHIHHNYAAVLSILGDIYAAEGHLREAIRLKPDYAEAFYNLSAIIKLRTSDPLVDQIEALLQSKAVSDEDRCFLHFAVAKFLDDLKEFDRAFAHYKAGNTAKNVQYDPRVATRFRELMAHVCTADLLQNRNKEAFKTALPIFVVGMPRSGTSLLEQILASHSAVFGAGELGDIKQISDALDAHTDGDVSYPHSLELADADVLRGLAKSYILRLKQMAPDAKGIVNKMPLNFWHVGLISSLFSHAKIIHCRRDPVDTCLSCYFQNFTQGQHFAFDLSQVGAFYVTYEKMMEHWRRVSPIPILEVNYEDLVETPEAVSKEIIAFLGLDWEPQCSAPHLTDRSVHTASRWQVRQPIYRSSRQRWRRYEKHISPLLSALSG
ncbi:MAG: sulfotransferase [Pseudomonadota bacterium]